MSDKILGCIKCGKELQFCSCPDIDERIRSAKNDPGFLFKMCKKCDRHYARCKCLEPKWGTNWDGVGIEIFDKLEKMKCT